jgi:phosphatidate cytidylyltransferase
LNNLAKRTITGIFLIIIVLGGIWLHPISCLLIGGIVLTGSVYEYYKLIGATGTNPQKAAGIITAITIYLISVFVASGVLDSLFYLIVIAELMFIIIAELFRKQEKPFDAIAQTVFGLVFTSVPFSLFPFMTFGFQGPVTILQGNVYDFSPGLILGVFILSWGFDIAAYLFGSWFGKHKLVARISPEKSWEGFLIGLVVTVMIAWLISLWIKTPDIAGWIIVGIIVAVTGTLGDLAESMLKRSAGVKDSGSLLPGHGGILDRFDSLILSIPFVFLYTVLFA